jgi:hypothetical protein
MGRPALENREGRGVRQLEIHHKNPRLGITQSPCWNLKMIFLQRARLIVELAAGYKIMPCHL